MVKPLLAEGLNFYAGTRECHLLQSSLNLFTKLWASADFWGFGVYFVRFPWFLLPVRDIQPPNPCISLLTQQSNGHRKNQLTRFRQVSFPSLWNYFQMSSNVSLCFPENKILELLPVNKADSVLFNSQILSLSVTRKSFTVRLSIYKSVSSIRSSMPTSANEHQSSCVKKCHLILNTG